MCGCLLHGPPMGTWPATQTCALTGNQTGDPLVCSPSSIHWATPARALIFFTSLKCHLQLHNCSDINPRNSCLLLPCTSNPSASLISFTNIFYLNLLFCLLPHYHFWGSSLTTTPWIASKVLFLLLLLLPTVHSPLISWRDFFLTERWGHMFYPALLIILP